jgi:hypothetical protein
VAGSTLTNTNTPGTTTFYAECSSLPGCRTATDLLSLRIHRHQQLLTIQKPIQVLPIQPVLLQRLKPLKPSIGIKMLQVVVH